MYVVQYRTKGKESGVNANASSFATEKEAQAAAATFIRTNGNVYDVFIARPFVKVSMKEDPLIVEEVRY